ncbi:polysaccharide deacetylase family protein [Haloferula helveola]|uniref:polysaccharide deacetylase family protein n=1 Tax=Haloferula helveola TaxID=490095 RepID=UPI00333EAE6E
MGVAVFDALWRLGGAWVASLLVVPAVFVLLHVLAFGLRLRKPDQAFWGWVLLLTLWAEWLVWRGGDTPVRWVAWGWIGFVIAQFMAVGALLWKRLMLVAGSVGIAIRIAIFVVAHLIMGGLLWKFGWVAASAAAVVFAGCWAWGTFRTSSRLFGPLATRIKDGRILLTFDDGPDPNDTPAILDLLDRHGVKAVFFVIGDKVREFPELAREIVERGHEIGNHTMTHPQGRMWGLGPGRTRREICECQDAVEEATGVRPRWFRAPVGHRNFFTHPVTRELGLDVVAWSRRSFDTIQHDPDRLVLRLTEGVTDGDILLLHEATPVAVDFADRALAELDRLRPSSEQSGDC